jgi:predicted lactoylglutathione lyase
LADLDRSNAFFTALGWSTNERFGDGNAACFVLDNGVHLMLATREFFASLGDGSKQVGDSAATTLVAFAFDFSSRDEVDAFIETARAAGRRSVGLTTTASSTSATSKSRTATSSRRSGWTRTQPARLRAHRPRHRPAQGDHRAVAMGRGGVAAKSYRPSWA